MTKDRYNILDSFDSTFKGKRLYFFPKWIVFFVYLFSILGGLSLIALILGLFHVRFPLALYGLTTSAPLSLTGLAVLLLVFFKGVVAFSLLLGQKWAVEIAIIDAIVGIFTCTLTMLVFPFIGDVPSRNVEIRLELLILIPYLVIMYKSNKIWKNSL